MKRKSTGLKCGQKEEKQRTAAHKKSKLSKCITKLCLSLCNPLDCSLSGSSAMGFPRQEQNTRAGWHCLLQGVCPTQGQNLCLLYCRWILYPREPSGKILIVVHNKDFSIIFKFFLIFYFMFKLYNIVLVLPNIEMNTKIDGKPAIGKRQVLSREEPESDL